METIDFDKATKIYYGKDNFCRCGCGGNYANKGERTFTRYKNAIENLLTAVGPVGEWAEDKSWFNISIRDNKAYTIYLNNYERTNNNLRTSSYQ